MTRKFAAAALAAVILSTAAAQADPIEDKELSINGGEVVLPLRAPAPEFLKDTFPEVISGHAYRDPDTRAMQSDDFSNPGMVFVDSGLAAWDAVEGTEGKSCANCHNGIESMKGVRAAMPKMNGKGDDLWSLENFVNNCRTTRMGADEWKWNSQEMKNMTAAISMQSRGMPVAVKTDGPAQSYWEKGKEIYYTRYGQLELACANCHEQHAGDMIRADHLSQGQINGFPTYRLKDAGMVSIHQRFVGCVRDTRAETFAAGSPEFRALELYVASRGAGLPVEGVSVRH
ncbi:sulfur oxidation c-type cytochrome SoxA [Paracoccus sanguinis]|uniref:sulfur oxidation c-type cytochrome SoxA n=1 Tax=Paracoccus sanguinis TaxID=1545044 RepID=UPI00051FABD3|nr:sulfur oxidation c-type cytochrome SoxA [Paracoccus sanguinis]KGJ19859.1 cytochrome C [Paracoccus sanguinis]